MKETLRSLILANVDCPVKWGFFQDGDVPPLVTLFTTGGSRNRTLNSNGLKRAMVQIDCWAQTYHEANETAKSAESSIDTFRDETILSATLSSERDGNTTSGDMLHRISKTFTVMYRE